MKDKTHYDTLGVQHSASDEELKTAFHRLAFEHHPDRNEGQLRFEDSFKDISKAYDVLSDPIQRARYDLTICPYVDEKRLRDEKYIKNPSRNRADAQSAAYAEQTLEKAHEPPLTSRFELILLFFVLIGIPCFSCLSCIILTY